MPLEQKQFYSRKQITFLLSYCVIFLSLLVISYYTELNHWLGTVLNLFRPVLLGLVFAYVANPVFRFYERIVFARLRFSALRRALSLFLTYLSFFLLIAGLLLLILPQLITSITVFINDYQIYVDSAVANINELFDALNEILGSFTEKSDFFRHIDGSQFFEGLYRLAVDFLASIDIDTVTSTAGSLISGVTDTLFALFISLYLLSSKEKRYAQVMKLRTAIFSDKTNWGITRFCTTADTLFGKFFEGKFLGSLIIGLLLYLFFSLFGIPFAIIFATFIATTNMIPLIGFVIGTIPSALILLLTDPEKFLPFLIIVFIAFWVDNNMITPKILGSNTGISALCVIIAICVTGRLFGLAGMLFGVPLFATLLGFSDQLIRRRLRKKSLPDGVENYYAPDPIINPMKHLNTGMSAMIRRLEKRRMHAEKQIDSGNEESMTLLDRCSLTLYKALQKFRILPKTSPDILIQFATENAQKQIRRAAEQCIAEKAEPIPASAASDGNNTQNPTVGGDES